MKKITKMSKEQYALKHNLKPEWFRDIKHISKFLNWKNKLEEYKKSQQKKELTKKNNMKNMQKIRDKEIKELESEIRFRTDKNIIIKDIEKLAHLYNESAAYYEGKADGIKLKGYFIIILIATLILYAIILY